MFGLALGLVETSGPEERRTILDGQLLDKTDRRFWDQMTILDDQFGEIEVNNYLSI